MMPINQTQIFPSLQCLKKYLGSSRQSDISSFSQNLYLIYGTWMCEYR
jgi:hypothetical protein